VSKLVSTALPHAVINTRCVLPVRFQSSAATSYTRCLQQPSRPAGDRADPASTHDTDCSIQTTADHVSLTLTKHCTINPLTPTVAIWVQL